VEQELRHLMAFWIAKMNRPADVLVCSFPRLDILIDVVQQPQLLLEQQGSGVFPECPLLS